MGNSVMSYSEIRALRVRERLLLMEDLWFSIWDKSPRKWFPLRDLIRAELIKRFEDGRL